MLARPPAAAPASSRFPGNRPPGPRLAADARRSNRLRALTDILSRSAHEAGAVALSPTLFVQAMLPHREVYALGEDGAPVEARTGRRGPGGSPETVRLLASSYAATNGDLTLSIRAGTARGPSVAHPRVSRGVPYGGLARLLLCHLVTEARKRDTPTLDLGRTITDFCARVHVTPSGGAHGRVPYVVDQLLRLATCVVDFQWEHDGFGQTHGRQLQGQGSFGALAADPSTSERPVAVPGRHEVRGENLLVVEGYHFWHQAASDAAEPADGGSITLGARFWHEVAQSAFPLDFRKAQFFRAHPLAYDLYLWLTYRLGALERAGRPHVAVSYDSLHAQLGSHYQTEAGVLTARGKKDFGFNVRKALHAVHATWPGLRVSTPRGRLVLYATGPDVAHRAPRRAQHATP